MKKMEMKKKGREEAKKKISKKTLSVILAAVLVSSALIAFMPLAAAGITSFTITPDTGTAGEVSPYTATLDTTGFKSLNMTIPAGFGAVAPGDGDLIVEVWLQDNKSNEYNITLTAKGTDKIDMCCRCGGDEVKYTFAASYGPGDTIGINVSFWGVAYANLTLPTDTKDGLLSMSLPKTLKKVIISIKEFVKNPAQCDDYEFDITVNGDTESATVRITAAHCLKEDAITELEAITTTNKHAQKDIDKAIKHIQKSLEGKLWVDGLLHLDTKHGKKVFDEEKKAVKHLMKITEEKGKHADPAIVDDVKAVIKKLTKADEQLATVAINDAKNTAVQDPKKQDKVDKEIAKAEEELAKAHQELANDKPDKAINHYKKAWAHAQKAIKHAQ